MEKSSKVLVVLLVSQNSLISMKRSPVLAKTDTFQWQLVYKPARPRFISGQTEHFPKVGVSERVKNV